MGTTQPIRDKADVKSFIEYCECQKPNRRNHALIVLGLHTALRISDILMLRWKDVYQFCKCHYVEHLFLYEKRPENPVSLLSIFMSSTHWRNSGWNEIPTPTTVFFQKEQTPPDPSAVHRHIESSRRLLNILWTRHTSVAIPCAKLLATIRGSRAFLRFF